MLGEMSILLNDGRVVKSGVYEDACWGGYYAYVSDARETHVVRVVESKHAGIWVEQQ